MTRLDEPSGLTWEHGKDVNRFQTWVSSENTQQCHAFGIRWQRLAPTSSLQTYFDDIPEPICLALPLETEVRPLDRDALYLAPSTNKMPFTPPSWLPERLVTPTPLPFDQIRNLFNVLHSLPCRWLALVQRAEEIFYLLSPSKGEWMTLQCDPHRTTNVAPKMDLPRLNGAAKVLLSSPLKCIVKYIEKGQ